MIEDTIESLRHQRDLLAKTLGECIFASGIIHQDIEGLTGPELLMFGDDLKQMLESQQK